MGLGQLAGGQGAKWQHLLVLLLLCAPGLVSKDHVEGGGGHSEVCWFFSSPTFYFGDWRDHQDDHRSYPLFSRRQDCWADSVPWTLASASDPHLLPGASSLLGAPCLLLNQQVSARWRND